MTRLVQFANNAVSTLAAGITNTATSASVAPGDGAKFPALSAGQYFMATLVKATGETEVVKVTARVTDTFTIERAQEQVAGAATAYAYSAGDRLEMRMTAGVLSSELDRLLDKSGDTMTGALNLAKGANVASASIIDLDAATGNLVHITGTTEITGMTLAAGASRTLVFDAATPLKHSTALLLPGAADITAGAGDTAVVVGEGSSVTRVLAYMRADGTTISPTPITRGGTGATTQIAALQALGVLGSQTVAKTATYAVVAADRGDVLLCSGTFSVTLDAAATLGNGFAFALRNTGTGTITIDPNSAETIDGVATKALKPGQSAVLICDGTNWVTVGLSGNGATGGGADAVFYENDQTVSSDYTITSGKNAMSAGDITIASGVTVTVPTGSAWTIV